jgi:NADPH2:quinone reductase
MKAAVYYQNGGPEVLRYETVPDPECSPKGIVIRVEAVSIEGGDTVNRWRGVLPRVPHIVGYQAAGEIVEVGAEVKHLRVGQRVVTTGAHGSHAELRAAAAATTWVIPEGMDVKLASTAPIPFGTADNCLLEYGRLQAGETVLVQAGASGVGIAAIQIAKRAGARVIATASSDERLARIAGFGVDVGINYRRDDLVQAVMAATDKRGVDVVLDGVGGDTLQKSIQVLAFKGRCTCIGFSGREGARIDAGPLMAANRSLIGLGLAYEMATDRVRGAVQAYLDDLAAGRLQMPIDRCFALSEAANAHAYIESRQAVGRVLLIP